MNHWNAFFSSLAFPEEVRRYAGESMVLPNFDLQSRMAIIKGIPQLGMTGKGRFKAVHYDRYWLGLIHTLTDFAFYSGVGAKTAIGMGQARRLESPARVAEQGEI